MPDPAVEAAKSRSASLGGAWGGGGGGGGVWGGGGGFGYSQPQTTQTQRRVIEVPEKRGLFRKKVAFVHEEPIVESESAWNYVSVCFGVRSIVVWGLFDDWADYWIGLRFWLTFVRDRQLRMVQWTFKLQHQVYQKILLG